jgi:hypothetical protein
LLVDCAVMWRVPVFVILLVICTFQTRPAQAQWPDDESVEEGKFLIRYS